MLIRRSGNERQGFLHPFHCPYDTKVCFDAQCSVGMGETRLDLKCDAVPSLPRHPPPPPSQETEIFCPFLTDQVWETFNSPQDLCLNRRVDLYQLLSLSYRLALLGSYKANRFQKLLHITLHRPVMSNDKYFNASPLPYFLNFSPSWFLFYIQLFTQNSYQYWDSVLGSLPVCKLYQCFQCYFLPSKSLLLVESLLRFFFIFFFF